MQAAFQRLRTFWEPPFLAQGPPTTVDVEPATGRVLAQDVLSLTHILPGIFHLHLVELKS